MSLEQKTRTNNKKTTRRNFLKKTLTTITSIILAAYIGISSPACKSYNNPTGVGVKEKVPKKAKKMTHPFFEKW